MTPWGGGGKFREKLYLLDYSPKVLCTVRAGFSSLRLLSIHITEALCSSLSADQSHKHTYLCIILRSAWLRSKWKEPNFTSEHDY